MARVKIQPGDIFSIPVKDDHYLFGRVLLDVKKQCIKPGLVDLHTRFATYGSAILVEVYSELSKIPQLETTDVLIPGIFVNLNGFKENFWKKIGNKEVDPRDVEFPQALTKSALDCQFERGEILVSLNITMEHRKKFESSPGIEPSMLLGQMALYHLNRRDLMDIEPKYQDNMSCRFEDCRFSDQIEDIYELLQKESISERTDLKPDEPYYELSKRLGKDISRFY